MIRNKQLMSVHIFIALLAGTFLYVGFRSLIKVADAALIMDAAVSGFILSGLLFFLKNVVEYSRFSLLESRQRIINYVVLGVLFIVCWLGVEYFILYISLSESEWVAFIPIIGIRIMLAILVYTLALFIYTDIHKVNENKLEDEEEVLVSLTELSEKIEVIERIAVKSGQKIDVVMISDIIYLQAEGDYVMIHSTKGKFLKEQTMKSFESQLPPDKFVRVHRSSIVNVDFIAQIELYDKQSQLLKMQNGSQVRISLTGYRLLKKVLGL